jgi:acetyltransferase-like isoleucine patch superfamily enzyme
MTRGRTLVHLLGSFARALPEWVIVNLPGEAGMALRQVVYRRRVRHLGRDVIFEPGVQLVGAEHMSFGDNCWIDKYVVLLAGPPDRGERIIARKDNPDFAVAEGELVIGPNTHIASHVVVSAHGGVTIGANAGVASGARVYSLSHHYRNPLDRSDSFEYRFTPKAPPSEQALISAPVVLGDNTAVGLNAVVLPGSTVGEGSWLGSGAQLRGRLPPGSIASGSPAEVVAWRPGREPA